MNITIFRRGKTDPSRPIAPLVTTSTKTSPAFSHTSTVQPKKILVVDDDAVILKTMSLKLASRGCAVVTARDASEAIAALRDEQPDLVILDISFPPDIANGGLVTWDGFQIMSWLRGLVEAGNIPFILITGGDPAQYKPRALAEGAVAFFHKPIEHDDLLRVVERAMSRHMSPSPVQPQ
jgi:CheY-like chemotaxis protein